MSLPKYASIRGFLALLAVLSCWAGESLVAKGQATNPGRDQTKLTEPPGQETDGVQKLIDQADSALRSGKSTTDILTDPSFVSVHEWPRFRKLIRQWAQASPITIVTPKETGEPLVLAGRVIDGDGRPMKEAVVYVYQTSAKGWYSDRAAHYAAHEGDRKHARLFGYLKTDGEGGFELRTIRPAGYPDSDLPAHIHVEVERKERGSGNFVTEAQFDDDPRLTDEWRKRSQQEGFVIGKVKKNPQGGQQVQVEFKVR
jgi:protocatechuate 3,4-dioxygenase beta subunit